MSVCDCVCVHLCLFSVCTQVLCVYDFLGSSVFVCLFDQCIPAPRTVSGLNVYSINLHWLELY